MNKILLIIKREYITRVRNKTFLLSTFLLPIMMMLFIFGSVFFATRSKEVQKKIAVINDTGMFRNSLQGDSARVIFDFISSDSIAVLLNKGYDGVLDLRKDTGSNQYVITTKKQLGISSKSYIEEQMIKAFEKSLLLEKNIKKETLDTISKATAAFATLKNMTWNGNSTKKADAVSSYGIGFGSGILIYITMFIFGAMVMRGVMEEKTNRIAEVMVSSIKPFQLMMGKIIGIACVGLTQLLLWLILIVVLTSVISPFIPAETFANIQTMQQNGQIPVGGMVNTGMTTSLFQTVAGFAQWGLIIPCFIFYFLGGYLFYAALFAAVGSVVNEDPQEAQSLMLPIMMPIIFGFIIMSSNLGNPDSPAMFWGSMIPFTSPIVMMGRIPSGTVPAWQIILSMLLLVGGFLFTTWLAAKIYRTGILLYGKKVTWKEMFKWAFRKS